MNTIKGYCEASMRLVKQALGFIKQGVRSHERKVLVAGQLETPGAGAIVQGLLEVRGWALPQGDKPLQFEILIDGVAQRAHVERVARPDVQAAFPKYTGTAEVGFSALLPTAQIAAGAHAVRVRCSDGRDASELGPVTFSVSTEHPTIREQLYCHQDEAAQRAKLKLLLPLLRCHSCHSAVSMERDQELHCAGCQQPYTILRGAPIMVSGNPVYPVEPAQLDSLPSNNPLSAQMMQRIDKVLARGGLVLEVGAGRKMFGLRRLVQLEICAYPFTDVVNQSDELPFADNSFDLVYSLAVTEHVKRPWVLAQELQRVLKPGGELVVDCAFMQPLHGYPSHYYNMTKFGLAELFKQTDLQDLSVHPHQTAWFALEALTRYLLTHAPRETSQLLGTLTLAQLNQECANLVHGRPSTLNGLELGQALSEELAAGFTLVAKKSPT